MKKTLLLLLSASLIACLTACGEEASNDSGNAVSTTTEAVSTVVQDTDNEPMNDEQLQAFLAVYKDFIGLAENFSKIYSLDEVEQNEKYDAYVTESYSLIDEIANADVENMTYDVAKEYVATINAYTETYQVYAEEIKAALEVVESSITIVTPDELVAGQYYYLIIANGANEGEYVCLSENGWHISGSTEAKTPFMFAQSPDGYWSLVDETTGMCWDVYEDKTDSPMATVAMYPRSEDGIAHNEKFEIALNGEDEYMVDIKSIDGLYVGASSSSTDAQLYVPGNANSYYIVIE